jgi:hypothetical protein
MAHIEIGEHNSSWLPVAAVLPFYDAEHFPLTPYQHLISFAEPINGITAGHRTKSSAPLFKDADVACGLHY